MKPQLKSEKPGFWRGLLRAARLLATGTLVFTLGVWTAPMPAAARPGAVLNFVVDSNNDSYSGGAPDGICYDGLTGCTLREAVREANANPGGTTSITTSLSNATIYLALGTLSLTGNHITINGTTMSNLTLDATANPAGTDVIDMQGNDNTLQNLTIKKSRRDGIKVGDAAGVGAGQRNLLNNVAVIGSVRTGIYVHNADQAQIYQTLVGTSSTANNLCATGQGNAGDGIVIDDGSLNTVVSMNRVVCNGYSGIYINGTGSTSGTQILSNWIGTDGTSYVMGNGFSGIEDFQANLTIINYNLISGNGWYGVWLHGSTNATLTTNKIGTTQTGNTGMANAFDGLLISDSANNNTIGSSSDALLGNVISGNTFCGITLTRNVHDNLVDGNKIGVGVNGTTAVPNGLAGVALTSGAHDNNIGSIEMITQTIAGNTREGVYVEASNANHIHLSNYIGLAGGGATPRGNGLEGVRMVNSSDNLVEGRYGYNGAAGVVVEGETSVRNLIVTRLNKDNGGLPVDLGNDGATRNGSHTPPGPNNWLAYPVVAGVIGNTLTGVSCADCYIFTYEASGNPAAKGGGGTFFSLVFADGSGIWHMTLGPGKKFTDYSFVACTGGLAGDCSEMSPRPLMYLPFARR